MKFNSQNLKDPYFTSRGFVFWVCFVYCLGIIIGIDGYAMLAPERFHGVFVAIETPPTAFDLILERARGVVALIAALIAMIAFLRKSGATRLLVKFALAFTVLFFIRDLLHMFFHDEALLLAQNPWVVAFLLARPIGIFCLFHIATDLERTRPFEAVSAAPGV